MTFTFVKVRNQSPPCSLITGLRLNQLEIIHSLSIYAFSNYEKNRGQCFKTPLVNIY